MWVIATQIAVVGIMLTIIGNWIFFYWLAGQEASQPLHEPHAIRPLTCLEVLNDSAALPDASIDLIYLDPPFNVQLEVQPALQGPR